MTRSVAREIAIHYSFELGFSSKSAEDLLTEQMTRERFATLSADCELYQEFPSKKQEAYIRDLVRGAHTHAPELDDYISRYAVGWSFSRIPRAAAAIMRIAMYEVLYMPDIPNAAAINEALEIAKGYEDPQVISFMNGILGSFVRAEFQDTPAKPQKVAEEETAETAPEVEEV